MRNKLQRFGVRLRDEMTIPVLFAAYIGLFVVRPYIADGPGSLSWYVANLAGFLPPVAVGWVLRGIRERSQADRKAHGDTDG